MVGALCLLLLSFIPQVSAQTENAVVPKYSASSGGYYVNIEKTILYDKDRNRSLHVNLLYPDGEGPFPVIVFSHGAGGSRDNYQYVTKYWASYGYVVIQPSHRDSIAEKRKLGISPGNELKVLREELDAPAFWLDRVRDVSFVLDSLPRIEADFPQLKGKINKNKIGIGGHSFGAFTAQAIAGATVAFPGSKSAVSLADKRVTAIVAMSPLGPGRLGFSHDSWKKQTVPAMLMTGSQDRSVGRRGPSWRKLAYTLSPAGDKYLLFIEGARHSTFAGRSILRDRNKSRAPAPDRLKAALDREQVMFDAIRVASLAFWDGYLKNGDSAKAYLETKVLPGTTQGWVRLESK